MSSSRWRPPGEPGGRRVATAALPQAGPEGVEVAQILSTAGAIPVFAPRTAQEIAAVEQRSRGEQVAVVLPSAADQLLPIFLPSHVVALFASTPGPDKLIAAGRVIATGEAYADPDLSCALLALGRRAVRAAHPAEQLSEREVSVLDLLAEGLSNRAIAARLFVSEHTIRNHLHRIYRKLGVGSRQEAIRVFRARQPSASDTPLGPNV